MKKKADLGLVVAFTIALLVLATVLYYQIPKIKQLIGPALGWGESLDQPLIVRLNPQVSGTEVTFKWTVEGYDAALDHLVVYWCSGACTPNKESSKAQLSNRDIINRKQEQQNLAPGTYTAELAAYDSKDISLASSGKVQFTITEAK